MPYTGQEPGLYTLSAGPYTAEEILDGRCAVIYDALRTIMTFENWQPVWRRNSHFYFVRLSKSTPAECWMCRGTGVCAGAGTAA